MLAPGGSSLLPHLLLALHSVAAEAAIAAMLLAAHSGRAEPLLKQQHMTHLINLAEVMEQLSGGPPSVLWMMTAEWAACGRTGHVI